MRSPFEIAIKGYRDELKKVPPERLKQSRNLYDVADAMAEDQLTALSGIIERTAREEKSDESIQTEIADIQLQKQQIVLTLRERLERIRRDEHVRFEEDGKERHFPLSMENGTLQTRDEHGNILPLTLGDVMTDVTWGNIYDFDDSIPSTIKKRYAFQYAKHELEELLFKQVAMHEASRASTHGSLRGGYLSKLSGRLFEQGHMAEK